MINTTQSHSLSQRNSYLDQLTRKEKIWGIIGLFLGLVAHLPFFAIIIFLIIASRVSERNKLKLQISQYLINHTKTHVSELSRQTGVSTGKIDTTLKIMILDDGEPIQYDTVQGQVKKMGRLSFERLISQSGSGSETVADEEPQTHGSHIPQEEERVSLQSNEGQDISCMQCGVKLPAIARYCNECGVRQLR